MPNTYLTKVMAAPSTTAVGTVSSAAVPVVTLNTSNFDTQRRLSFWSSAVALSSTCLVTVKGTMEGGIAISETIVPSTVATTANVSVQDFLSVTSVTVSCRPNSVLNIGLSSLGSTPWRVANSLADPFLIGFGLTYSSSAAAQTFAAVEFTLDDPTNVYDPVGGTFVPAQPQISTAISTTGGAASGKIDFPVTAWRLTIDTSATVPVTVALSAVPAGIGS
jgi:hypothetical protein